MEQLRVYRGKSVLVTGHTGFKGSWLTQWLVDVGAQVTGLALAPRSEREHFSLLDLEPLIDHHLVDIRDQAGLDAVFARAEPEFLMKEAFSFFGQSFRLNPLYPKLYVATVQTLLKRSS